MSKPVSRTMSILPDTMPTPTEGDGPGNPNGRPEIVEAHEEEAPTESHAVANEAINAGIGEDGAMGSNAGRDDVDVEDLGWKETDQTALQPIITGLHNDTLFTLIRRFDNQIFCVRTIDKPPLANLDMNISEDEEFSPGKLRARLERLYTSVIVQLISGWKHLMRLRSWNEYQRTSTYLAVYLGAWLLDILLPVSIVFLMGLILSPRFRHICFPPMPRGLINAKTGDVQKPEMGVLGADDTVTGAPEAQTGEGVEQEAHSFINSITTLLVSTSIGKHPQDSPDQPDDNGAPDINAPDLTQIQQEITTAGSSASTQNTGQDKTKKPVSKIVWKQAESTMRIVADVIDNWERVSNALNPTLPFRSKRPRIILASCLILPLLGSYFVTSYMLVKGVGFSIGLGLFGDPVLRPVEAFLARNYPNFKKYLIPRNSILRGVPTNAQIAVTLLRMGERSKAPVPPPQSSETPPPTSDDQSDQSQITPASKDKPKKTKKFVQFLRNVTGGSIKVLLSTDKVKAAAGEKHAQNRLGVLNPPDPEPYAGPVSFPARFKGQKGYVYITTTATSPALSWTSDLAKVDPAWSLPIADITKLRKVGGLGWKSRIVVSWALEKKIMDGLIITSTDEKEHHLTAVAMRDELFNRLVAVGAQMWEVL